MINSPAYICSIKLCTSYDLGGTFFSPKYHLRVVVCLTLKRFGPQKARKMSAQSWALPDNMAVMERISLEQLNSQLAMTILASWGSKGNSAIMEPSSVRSPSSLRAAR